MGILEVLKDVVERLESKKLDYFLVGSMASMYYGKPRFTNDIDLVISIRPTQLKEFAALFPIESYYCPPEEILSDEVMRSGSFNLIHQETQVKIDINLLKPTEFDEGEMSRRKRVSFSDSFDVFIASPEDVILKKLVFYREGGSEKHVSDIKGILIDTSVDQKYLESWVHKLGLVDEWKKAKF